MPYYYSIPYSDRERAGALMEQFSVRENDPMMIVIDLKSHKIVGRGSNLSTLLIRNADGAAFSGLNEAQGLAPCSEVKKESRSCELL